MVILPSIPNFRCLGGIKSSDGRHVRSGHIYRAEGPRFILPDDAKRLNSMGLVVICDLRSQTERMKDESFWYDKDTTELIHADVLTDLRAEGNAEWENIATDISAGNARQAMIDNYRKKPEAMIPHFSTLFSRIVDGIGLPMMIHCTAGKDRTGFAVAILLFTLGVRRDDVFDDYVKTDDFLGSRFDPTVHNAFVRRFGKEPSEGALAALRRADPNYLEAALDGIAVTWGSIENYIESAIGIDAGKRSALKALLLE